MSSSDHCLECGNPVSVYCTAHAAPGSAERDTLADFARATLAILRDWSPADGIRRAPEECALPSHATSAAEYRILLAARSAGFLPEGGAS